MYRDARRPPPQRNRVALTGSSSRASGPRRALQIALGALSWVGFGLLWLWQLEVYVPATWLYSICLIAIILGTWILFTIGWVRWNRNIYDRRHRRTTPVRMEVGFEHDSLGRPIRASGGIRAAEGQVLISVDEDGAKRYERERKRPALPRLPALPEIPRRPRELPAALAAALAAANGAAPANGNGVHPNGNAVYANGVGAHANGVGAPLSGNGAYANGHGAYANGVGAPLNGDGAHANGHGAHASGANVHANGDGAHPSDDVHPDGVGANGNGNGNGRRRLSDAEWLLERAR